MYKTSPRAFQRLGATSIKKPTDECSLKAHLRSGENHWSRSPKKCCRWRHDDRSKRRDLLAPRHNITFHKTANIIGQVRSTLSTVAIIMSREVYRELHVHVTCSTPRFCGNFSDISVMRFAETISTGVLVNLYSTQYCCAKSYPFSSVDVCAVTFHFLRTIFS